MITLSHVTKRIGDFQLSDITFTLPKGYIMGLVGANGAGKTSLLHIILGLYRPEEGTVLLNGTNSFENEKATKDAIGFVLAESLFSEDLSLLQNARFYGAYYSNYKEETLLSYLERFGLDKTQKYKKCSRGQKFKFQLAFALSHEAKLLILDEPTASFDPEFQKQVQKILTEFVSDGEHSVLIASHQIEELERITDYITYIEHGKLGFSMEVEQLKNKYRVVRGEEYKIHHIYNDNIIYQEKRAYETFALVRHTKYQEYDREVIVELPSLENLMYCFMKGGY